MPFIANCRATGIGSLPHTAAAEAVEAVFRDCPDLPYWPQLPNASRAEGMNEQALVGLPGLRAENGRLRLVQDDAFFEDVERLLAAHEAGDASFAALSPESACAFRPFLDEVRRRGCAEAKGQVAGPITVGMAVKGEGGNPILYDDVLRDVLTKFLALRVRWQAERIAEAGAAPVVFVDEPFLASYGTPFFGWDKPQVQETLAAVTAGAEMTGSHCCSNTEWSLFLGGPVRAVSFDAWEFADNFLVYRDDLRAFLESGGTIVWGIVPTDPDQVAAVTVDALLERMDGLLAKVEALGFTRATVLRQSLVTPACGLGTRPLETADRAFALTRDLAARLRKEYLGG
jgi:methionine synthase II (cobalamin-independent)